MSYGVTNEGFVAKRLADIKDELEDAYRSVMGQGINVDAAAPLGQIIGIHAEREAAIWELAEIVYNSRYPDSAEGASLDNVASVTNTIRLEATYSQVTVTISGSNGTVVPVGFTVSVDGDPTARFATTEEVTISGGTADAAAQAEDAGEVRAVAGTLTVIETPISGVTSATNALDAEVGRDLETDAEMRIRRIENLARAGSATVEGIRNAILEVDDVIQASVIENATGEDDDDGRPPHSIEAVVSGGADEDIAEAIFASKGAGIETYGSDSEEVVDGQGMTHTVYFSRPSEVPVYLRLTIAPNDDPNEGATYPENGDDAVKAAVVAYAESAYTLGRDVILNQLYTPVNSVGGIFGLTVQVSLNGSTWSSANLEIGPSELPTFDTSRITVVS